MVRDPNTLAADYLKESLRSTFGKEDDDVDDDDEELSNDEKTLDSHRSFRSNIFHRSVCDKAQKVKSALMKSHRELLLLRAKHSNLCTATPMLNRRPNLGALVATLPKYIYTPSQYHQA